MVGAVHQQHAAARKLRLAQLRAVPAGAGDEVRGVTRDVTPVRVGAVEVLRAHLRSVGRVPVERGAVDRARYAPPHHRVVQARLHEQLRHVGEVPHPHRRRTSRPTLDLGRPPEPELQIPDDGLARHHELVHEDHPRADLQPTRVGQRLDARRGRGSHLEVVVDHSGLPVEEEPRVPGIALQEIEELVDEVDELHAVGLERRVPLTVPVGVGNDGDRLGGLVHGASLRVGATVAGCRMAPWPSPTPRCSSTSTAPSARLT